MKPSETSQSNHAIADGQNSTTTDYEKFKIDNKAKITLLAAEIGPLKEQTHWELIDEMKGRVGSTAANESSDSDDMDSVLSEAEDWVNNNCSDGGLEEDVAMSLWLYGAEGGKSFLEKEKCPQSLDALTPSPL